MPVITPKPSNPVPLTRATGAKLNPFAGRPLFNSNYAAKDRARLIAAYARAVQTGHVPAGTPMWMGTYGTSKEDADAVHSLPSGVYAPIVTPQAKEHPVRALRGALQSGVPSEADLYDQRHPTLAKYKGSPPPLDSLSPQERFNWGLEMGRRIRDRIRTNSTARVPDSSSPSGYRLVERYRVDSYQLDELWPSMSNGGQTSRVLMKFFAGVLHGVREGRPDLGDRPMRGAVFLAHPGVFAKLPPSSEKAHLLGELDQTAAFLVGESYPAFAGGDEGAKKAAHRFMAGARELLDDGPHGRALAKRYVIGATPGMKPGRALGGRLHDASGRPTQSIAAANRWRKTFLEAAIAEGSRGLSEFSWTLSNDKFFHRPGLNTATETMRTVMRQMGDALR